MTVLLTESNQQGHGLAAFHPVAGRLPPPIDFLRKMEYKNKACVNHRPHPTQQASSTYQLRFILTNLQHAHRQFSQLLRTIEITATKIPMRDTRVSFTNLTVFLNSKEIIAAT